MIQKHTCRPQLPVFGSSSPCRILCAQILASIGQLEFFYDQAPDVMRSCSMALQLLSVAIGSYLSGALVYAVGAYTQGGCHLIAVLVGDESYGGAQQPLMFSTESCAQQRGSVILYLIMNFGANQLFVNEVCV